MTTKRKKNSKTQQLLDEIAAGRRGLGENIIVGPVSEPRPKKTRKEKIEATRAAIQEEVAAFEAAERPMRSTTGTIVGEPIY